MQAHDALRIRLSPNRLPDELLATDRIMLRWAASVGDGLTDPAWTELVRSRVPELSWDVAIIVDQTIMRAQPREYREVVTMWYRSSAPRMVIAERLRVREDEVYVCWQGALAYFRRFFGTSPNNELRRLSEITPRERLAYVRGALTQQTELA